MKSLVLACFYLIQFKQQLYYAALNMLTKEKTKNCHVFERKIFLNRLMDRSWEEVRKMMYFDKLKVVKGTAWRKKKLPRYQLCKLRRGRGGRGTGFSETIVFLFQLRKQNFSRFNSFLLACFFNIYFSISEGFNIFRTFTLVIHVYREPHTKLATLKIHSLFIVT